MDGVIPLAMLEAARARAKRQLASELIRAMGDAGMGCAEMAAQLGDGTTAAHVQSYLVRLIDAKPIKGLDDLIDLATALGREFWFWLPRREQRGRGLGGAADHLSAALSQRAGRTPPAEAAGSAGTLEKAAEGASDGG